MYNNRLFKDLEDLLLETELVCSRLLGDIIRLEVGKFDKTYYKANIVNGFMRLGYLLKELDSSQDLVNNSVKQLN